MTEAEPALRIGRVLKAHGVKGALRIELLTDFPDRFAPGNEVEVAGRRLTVVRAEGQDGGLLVTFNGIDDRGAAELLTGEYCTLPLSEAPRFFEVSSVPTLALYGPDDHVIWRQFPEMCEVAFSELVGPFVVPRAGHFLQWERAELFNRAVEYFLRDLQD